MTISQAEVQSLLHYDPENGRFTWLVNASTRAKAGSVAGCVKRDGYLTLRIKGKAYSCHRLAWFYVHGVWPTKIDHKDRNPLNNALNNLREATTSQNAMNTGATCVNTSGFRGVTRIKSSGKWMAQSRLNGKSHYLGVFESPERASEAYERFCKKNHGAFYSGNEESVA
jgi:TPR repeat protein